MKHRAGGSRGRPPSGLRPHMCFEEPCCQDLPKPHLQSRTGLHTHVCIEERYGLPRYAVNYICSPDWVAHMHVLEERYGLGTMPWPQLESWTQYTTPDGHHARCVLRHRRGCGRTRWRRRRACGHGQVFLTAHMCTHTYFAGHITAQAKAAAHALLLMLSLHGARRGGGGRAAAGRAGGGGPCAGGGGARSGAARARGRRPARAPAPAVRARAALPPAPGPAPGARRRQHQDRASELVCLSLFPCFFAVPPLPDPLLSLSRLDWAVLTERGQAIAVFSRAALPSAPGPAMRSPGSTRLAHFGTSRT